MEYNEELRAFSQLFVYMGKYAYLDNDYSIMLDYWGVVLF